MKKYKYTFQITRESRPDDLQEFVVDADQEIDAVIMAWNSHSDVDSVQIIGSVVNPSPTPVTPASAADIFSQLRKDKYGLQKTVESLRTDVEKLERENTQLKRIIADANGVLLRSSMLGVKGE